MNKEKREIARKLRVLGHAEETGQVAKTCRYFGVSRSSFYRWRTAYGKFGEAGLVNRPPIPKWHVRVFERHLDILISNARPRWVPQLQKMGNAEKVQAANFVVD